MNNLDTRESLLKRIKDRRSLIRSFLSRMEPTATRLTNFNIICGAIATFLTAAPAVGGKTVLEIFGSSDPNSGAWRIPFALAALFSLLSTIAANLYKSQDITSQLSKAQACDAKLEGLEAFLEINQIGLKEAATQYTQYISEIPFVSDDHRTLLRWRSSLDQVKGEILEPASDQAVEKTISCVGWVEGVGPGCHLWLAVESGGFFWPKERELHPDKDGSWKDRIYEEGNTESFSVSLFVANDKANKQIRAWLDHGDATGNYQEMRRLPGTRRVARVDGLHRKLTP